MDLARYFDNAATTPVDPRVAQAMLPFLTESFGNASSIHAAGREARSAVERAREHVADLIGAEDPSQILFTAGATESNNWILRRSESGAFSPFEHSAIREPSLALGFSELDHDGLSLRPCSQPVELVSVMSVNNEIGTIWSAADLRGAAAYVHSDLTQSVGKLLTNLDGIDYASLSAHKFYGPKGVGALYYAASPPSPYLLGGEQEHGLRAGTLNVPGIVGLGAAAKWAAEELEENVAHVELLRSAVVDGLRRVSDWQINGGNHVSPYILSISFLGVEGETLVIEADRAGFAISSGAACSSQSTEPSHVLMALGMEPAWRRGTVRISFGKFNDVSSAGKLAETLASSVEKLRTMT